mmetsp:Transcript_18599/g.52282  ORF Transcript_18599/g.52282 Transcript_18599/m.52282 type:complete len:113 (-) Transcript_18599:1656-1994(-)
MRSEQSTPAQRHLKNTNPRRSPHPAPPQEITSCIAKPPTAAEPAVVTDHRRDLTFTGNVPRLCPGAGSPPPPFIQDWLHKADHAPRFIEGPSLCYACPAFLSNQETKTYTQC